MKPPGKGGKGGVHTQFARRPRGCVHHVLAHVQGKVVRKGQEPDSPGRRQGKHAMARTVL